MTITGTFIDEISHDIPHQNWGKKEWRADFLNMKSVGIDTVIMIRSGYRKQLTYPSKYLTSKLGCFAVYDDLLEMFLELADELHMNFFFGLYDSGRYWDTLDMSHEIDVNKYVIEEVWQQYGHHPSFKGWYLSMELSRRTKGATRAFSTLGKMAKDISQGLPTLMSPWIDGIKAVNAFEQKTTREAGVSLETHTQEWDEIFDELSGAVDIVAFQDGHVSIEELPDFLDTNAQLGKKHGMTLWSNTESFDRDMPIKFLPIKFDKLRRKIECVNSAHYSKVITFEFSHFMSPQSSYIQAHHLFNRYKEYLNQLK